MPLFIGQFENKVDSKGRVTVPVTFRHSLVGQNFHGVIAYRSTKVPAIDCVSMDRMNHYAAGLDGLELNSDEQDDLIAMIFEDSVQLPFDKDGRVMLPKDLAEHADIADRALFAGRARSFRIWEPTAFRAHNSLSRERGRREGLTLRLPSGGEDGGK